MAKQPMTPHEVTFEHRTLNERVLSKIRELILAGAIPSGGQLDEQALADRMRISRTPVREAISKLNKEGIVEYRPYKGNFVRTFTVEQVNNLFEVRKALEGLAIRLAVARLTDAHLVTLHGVLHEIQSALEQGDIAAYSASDRSFHSLIAHIGENDSLVEMLERLDMQITITRTIANRDAETVARTAHERSQIVAAMEQRDPELASQLLESHIEGVRRSVITQLEAGKLTDVDPGLLPA